MKKIVYSALYLIAIALFPSCSKDDEESITNEYNAPDGEIESVDLGLPSGTLWAAVNIGAVAPEDNGTYYAWGEIDEKNRYDWSNYKYMAEGKSSGDDINKYTADDGLSRLSTEDDVASVKWGGKWRIPTTTQWNELKKECTWEWTSNGYTIWSNVNGNSIFLPAAGYCDGTSLKYSREYGSYWTQNRAGKIYEAQSYAFKSGAIVRTNNSRCYGNTIRAVCPKPKNK